MTGTGPNFAGPDDRVSAGGHTPSMRRRPRFWVTLVPSLLLHGVALVLLVFTARPRPGAVTPRSVPAPIEVRLEVAHEDSSSATESSASGSSRGANRDIGRARGATEFSGAVRSALHALEAPELSSPPSALEVASESASGAQPRSQGPSLNLAQLGLGAEGQGLFEKPGAGDGLPGPRRDRSERHAERRLELSLQQQALDRDREVGLGPEGPLLAALRRETQASTVVVNGRALLRATLNREGLLELTLLQATEDAAAWTEVAQRVRQTLRKWPVHLADQARALQLDVEVVSINQLPSGADPGLGVDVLGIPLKKGKGPKSARISILEPHLSLEHESMPMPDGDTVELPRLNIGFNVFGLAADPSDIGAKARRVVRARVTRARLL